MPLKTFWCFSKNVDRHRAELDLRLLDVMASVTSSEAYGALQGRLQRHLGKIVTFEGGDPAPVAAQEEQLDRIGLAELKAMAR